MLSLERVGKTYPNGVRALDGVSLEVEPGEIVAVVGGSGCGKSTLLRAVSGLDTPTPGRGRARRRRRSPTPHEKIGIIFQEPRLLPWLTRRRQRRLRPRGPAEARSARERVARAARPRRPDRQGRASGRANCPAGRRSASRIARALVPRPEVLLLDEPFSALDAFTRVDLQDHLLDLWADCKPTLVVRHPRRRRGDRARRPHRGDAAASRPDRRRDRDRPAAPARPPVGGVRFRQAARAGGARPLARPRRAASTTRETKAAPRRGDVVVDAPSCRHARPCRDRRRYTVRSSRMPTTGVTRNADAQLPGLHLRRSRCSATKRRRRSRPAPRCC